MTGWASSLLLSIKSTQAIDRGKLTNEGPSLEALTRRAGDGGRSGLSAMAEAVLGVRAGAWKRTPPPEFITTCVTTWTEALGRDSFGSDEGA